jgi:hypothetical protein
MARRVYGDFSDFAAFSGEFGGFWDSVKKAAGKVVPKHTIVGKMLSGNIGGAVKSTAKLVTGGSAASASAGGSRGTTSATGARTDLSQSDGSPMPGWVMPVAVGGGLLLVAMVFLKGKGKRR